MGRKATPKRRGRPTDQGRLLALIPDEVDGTISGARLMEALGWQRAKLMAISEPLIAAGTIVRGVGMSGSYRRTQAAAKRIGVAERERDLYEPLRKAWDDWRPGGAARAGVVFSEAFVTATLGGRSTGKWSKPDTTGIEVFRSPYLANPAVTVTTVEVKRRNDVPGWTTGALEAASHHRWAHRAILAIEKGKDEPPEAGISDELLALIDRFGLGLIRIRLDGYKHCRVEWVRDAKERDPAPRPLAEQLERVFADDTVAGQRYRAAVHGA